MSAEAGRVAAGRMRAWRVHSYGGAGELRLDAVRAPPLRAPDQLLVRVRAAALNPLDVAMAAGYGARALDAARALAGEPRVPPLVCGRDVLGEVVRAGPAARLRPAQRVWAAVPPWAAGTHADLVVVRDSWAGPAPEALSDAEAGGAPYAALTASAALRAAGLERGAAARVLLLGLGGVGQAALQLLVARGARVVVGCARELHALAGELGAAAALDRHAADYEARLESAGPYAAVVDCAGLGGRAADGRWGGARYVTLSSPLLRETDARGLAAGGAAAAAALAAQSARAGGAGRVRWALFAPSAAALEEVRALAERGRFRVALERVFPWWAARAAYERAARGAARGKLVLDFAAPEPAAAELAAALAPRPPDDVPPAPAASTR